YPRNEEEDRRRAEKIGVDYLFIPKVEEMYPEKMGIKMTIHQGTDVLCGKTRPDHLDGVITVLTKLFHIIQPTKAYFGLKDAQQFAVVNTLVSELNFPIKLVGLPTVREEDGLAKSSRNVYLSDNERKEAAVLYEALTFGQKLIVDGIKNPVTIIKEVKNFIAKKTSGKIDYIELLSYPDLSEIRAIESRVILALAVHFHQARLIDNMILEADGTHVSKID